jgi:hypothetical protein
MPGMTLKETTTKEIEISMEAFCELLTTYFSALISSFRDKALFS